MDLGKIFCILGKSGTGKDTLYSGIIETSGAELIPVVPYTTRPRRNHEVDGENYHFVTEQELRSLEEQGLVVEKRSYNTVHGVWTYFTRKFDPLPEKSYLVITTPEGAHSFIKAFGREAIELVYLEVEDGLRLTRCVERESLQSSPNYSEVCRRYLADEEDFSKEKLSELDRLHVINSGAPVEVCLERWREIYDSMK